ncbi:hypothetical protein QL285_068504 [Trifolium repens]|nr:hypothetical protein QL285_068504 [Trifolium repens]
MDVKGINWVGDMYQKFENMCLEAEDMMYEDTVEYIETQIQTVGDSVKKLYSDIVGDIIPSISCILDEKEDSELPIDQRTDAGFCKKPVQNFIERSAKANTKKTNNGLRVDHNDDNNNNVVHKTSASFMPSSRSSVKKSNIVSRPRQYAGSMDIKPNLGIDVNKVNEKMAATKIFNEITSVESDTRMPPQCCEISNEDQNHIASVSMPASYEVARLATEADNCNEIENACSEQFPYVLVQVKSAEEKQIGASSSSYDDTQGHKAMEEDHLKLEETCVIVTGDDLQLIPKEIGNLKKTRRQGFSLSKKSARKQEYKELAVWHGNNEKVKRVPSVSESEWELL